MGRPSTKDMNVFELRLHKYTREGGEDMGEMGRAGRMEMGRF